LSLGQAGGADKIRIEKIGINFRGASIKDNDGVLYQERRIDDGPDAIMTSLSCMDIIQLLGNENIPSTLSLSAGGFICNLVYFTSLEGMSGDALFIHLPYAEGEGNPSLSISYMRDAIVKVLEYIKRIEK
jgi:pyroglutamyl-peptidase